ncbi:MAG: hypothetical protein HYX38_21220 [Rhodospirillales bacterium]|nr:hypothetical protein [Rhodospirillales bacterium]
MADPLDVVAARIARLTLPVLPETGRIGPGPVLTVVRNTLTGKLYIGFNEGVPRKLADTLYKATLEQHARIWQGEVVVVRTDAEARGAGHSEVNALNPAILEREKVLGRKLVEQDLAIFELHNVWLRGNRAMTTAPRCEHCARITRGVTVTQSLFVAEGGVVGEINVPQRGSVLAAGGGPARPATTAGGEVEVAQRGSVTPAGSGVGTPVTTAAGQVTVPQRGSVTRAGSSVGRPVTTASGEIGGGGGLVGPMVGGVLTAAWVLSVPLIKQWFAKNYLNDKWTAEAQAMVVKAIEGSVDRFNVAIMARKAEIDREKVAGREVRLRVDVDTEWVDTDFGPAQIKASVSYYTVMLQGETPIEWPLFQPGYGFWSALFHRARITNRRQTYYFTL